MNTTIQIIQEATTAALSSMFLEFCFREKNIFSFWLPMWAKLYRYIFPYPIPDNIKIISETDGECLTERDYIIWKAWVITKPLGYCVVCFNFWVTLFYEKNNLFNYELKEVILIFVLSSFLVRFFQEKIT